MFEQTNDTVGTIGHVLPGWNPEQSMSYEVEFGTTRIKIHGVWLHEQGKVTSVGSAADVFVSSAAPPHRSTKLPCEARAMFELLERYKIAYHERNELTQPACRARSLDGSSTGSIVSLQDINLEVETSPKLPPGSFSRSNGCALGSNFMQAARSARTELIERDLLLRSWYGELPLQPTTIRPVYWNQALDCALDLQVGIVVDPTIDTVLGHRQVAAAAIAYPRDPRAKLSVGFGAGTDPESSTHKAFQELLQSIASHWDNPDDDLDEGQTEAFSGPLLHQSFYLKNPNDPKLRAWIAGQANATSTSRAWLETLRRTTAHRPDTFVELADSFLPEYPLVRALSGERIPLRFGLDFDGGLHPIP